jgi:hypothetical protein
MPKTEGISVIPTSYLARMTFRKASGDKVAVLTGYSRHRKIPDVVAESRVMVEWKKSNDL